MCWSFDEISAIEDFSAYVPPLAHIALPSVIGTFDGTCVIDEFIAYVHPLVSSALPSVPGMSSTSSSLMCLRWFGSRDEIKMGMSRVLMGHPAVPLDYVAPGTFDGTSVIDEFIAYVPALAGIALPSVFGIADGISVIKAFHRLCASAG